MKKILSTFLLLILIFMGFATASYGAANCDLQAYVGDVNDKIVYVTYRCTAHTDNSLSYTFTDDEMKYIGGGLIYYLIIDPATATTCKDNSDISLTDEFSLVPYTAAGNGLDLVHSTDTNGKIPENLANEDWYYPVATKNNLTIAMTNNDVASCTFDATFVIYR